MKRRSRDVPNDKGENALNVLLLLDQTLKKLEPLQKNDLEK